MYSLDGPSALEPASAFGPGGVRVVEAGDGDTIRVADSALLFHGDYVRDGADLVIDAPGHRLVVHDYFTVAQRPRLVAPDGASLADAVIAALARPLHGEQVAQAGQPPASDASAAIGRVQTVTGAASAVRNGVTVALHVGDLVYKGDVVATDRASALAIAFLDGTLFNLSAGARMVLSEMVYQADGANNAALFNLVQGSITFVAGQVAKTGDMKVGTPVATMGIRGTAVHVTISADDGTTRFSVMTEPDGHTGRFDVYDRNDPTRLLFTVSDPGLQAIVRPDGPALVQIEQVPKSPAEVAFEAGLVLAVFRAQAEAPRLPVYQGPSTGGGGGSSTDPNVVQPPSAPAAPNGGGPRPEPAPPSGGEEQPRAGGGAPTAPPAQAPAPSPEPQPNLTLAGSSVSVTQGGALVAATVAQGVLSAATGIGVHVVGGHAGAAADMPDLTLTGGSMTLTGRYGTLVLTADGTYAYVADRAAALAQDEHATDVFRYTARDGSGGAASATLTVDVAGSNDAPVADAGAASAAARAGTEAVLRAAGTIAFADADLTDAHTVSVAAPSLTRSRGGAIPADAGAALAGALAATLREAGGAGTVDYAFAVGDGAVAFLLGGERLTAVYDVAVSDGHGGVAHSLVTITVTGLDHAPVAQDASASVPAGRVLTGTLSASDVDSPTLTYAPVTGPAHGTLALQADGRYTYVPAAGYYGGDGFSFRANDGTLDSNVATVTIGAPPGVAPVAQDASADLPASRVLAGMLTATDVDSPTLTYAPVTGPAHGTLTLRPDGRYTYVPAAGYYGGDGFSFRANDGTLDSNVATVTIGAPPDLAPVAEDASADLPASRVLTGTLSATDADSPTLTYAQVEGPAHGTVTIEPDGHYTYTPDDGYYGDDGFSFRVNDGTLESNIATVTIGAPPDLAPVAEDASAGLPASRILTGTLSATDVDSPALTYAQVEGPRHGTLIVQPDGRYTYTPADGYYGGDSFTFRASDGTLESNVATVTIGAPPDLAPVAEDAAPTVPASRVLRGTLGASDPDSPVLTYAQVTGPAHGTLTVQPDGDYTYTPTDGYYGGDGFTFRASDGTLDSNLATVTIGAPPDLAPVAQDLSVAVPANRVLTGVLIATDVDSSTLTYAQIEGPAHGTLTLQPDGDYIYTPADGYYGGDSFTFRASDGTLDSNLATVTIGAPPDLAPVAEDAFTAVPASRVLTGAVTATDVDSSSLTYALTSGPAHGTLTLASDGRYTYRPDEGYYGGDRFTFRANDGTLDSNIATVTIGAPPDIAPVAEDATVAVPASRVLTGALVATDVDSPALTYAQVDGPMHGTLILRSDGGYIYTPADGYYGGDRFTFRANDGTLDSNIATVTIGPPPDIAPVAEDATVAVPASRVLTGVLVATDVDSPTLTYARVEGPAHGTLILRSDGGYTYTPADGYYGGDRFTFRANDGTLDSNIATVTIGPPPDIAPVAEDATVAVPASRVLTGVLVATDVDSPALTYARVEGPAHGTLTLGSDGRYTYTPDAGYRGSDGFTFQASDGTLTSNTATVTMTPPPNAAPAITHGASASLALMAAAIRAPQGAVASGAITAGNSLVVGLGGTPGFGETTLEPNDDESSSAIDITGVFGAGGLNFFGGAYTSIYINTNGNITFNGPSATFVPTVIDAGADNPIIAPFFADVDTRGGAAAATQGGTSTGSNLIYVDQDAANGVVTITWDDVGYYNSRTDSLNAFQLQLVDLGGGDFDIVFRYEAVNWTLGSASEGQSARAGYAAGNGENFYELPQSGDATALLALPTIAGNTGIAGVYVFQVEKGAVTADTTLRGTGTVDFSDADADDRHGVTTQVEAASVQWRHADGRSAGTVSAATTSALAAAFSARITQDGATANGSAGTATWTLALANSEAAFLAAGDTLSVTYDVIVGDGSASAPPATVAVTITGVNDAPTSGGDHALTVARGGTATLTPADLAGTDPDTAAADLVYTVVTDPHGRFTVDGTTGDAMRFTQGDVDAGRVRFHHDGSALGTTPDAVVLTLSDGAGGSSRAALNLTVTPDTTVVTADDHVVRASDATGPLAIPTEALLFNDRGGDGSPLHLHAGSVAGLGSGYVASSDDAAVTVTVQPAASGHDAFTYRAADEGDHAGTLGTVSVATSTASGTTAQAIGGAGDDILFAGPQDTRLTGGGGHDVFVFDTPGPNPAAHTITDFSATQDAIDLPGLSAHPAITTLSIGTYVTVVGNGTAGYDVAIRDDTSAFHIAHLDPTVAVGNALTILWHDHVAQVTVMQFPYAL
ncbi:Ig-like domain-containing protein [uncultured Methylobacterium sp.]|uniref:Ig-like domain-containing protein n=1 Tax=uncultured Methylobacterium sp. TaxID=157278 RepID=UPI0035CA03B5